MLVTLGGGGGGESKGLADNNNERVSQYFHAHCQVSFLWLTQPAQKCLVAQ